MYPMRGKHILLTGAAGGLGLEMARLVAQRGALPILVDVDQPGLKRAVQELLSLAPEGGVLALHADLARHEERVGLAAQLAERGVPVDILVNNAATTRLARFHDAPWEDVRLVLGLNLDAVVHLCHLFVPGMVARGGGAVLNLSSTSAFVPCPGMLCYSASKAFVNNFSETLRIELEPHRVIVRYACPGATATGFFVASGLDALNYVRQVPMMDPAKVARGCLALLDRPAGSEVVGLRNRLNMLAAKLMPRSLLRSLVRRRFR